MPDENVEITAYLRRLRDGDSTAEEGLADAVYGRMLEMGRAIVRGDGGKISLQPTALVNEVLLELLRVRTVDWNDRTHFYRVASRLLRRRLIDYIRKSHAGKRPPAEMRVELDKILVPSDDRFEEILSVHEALDELEKIDQPMAELVEMVYFGGVQIAALAELRGVSEKTILRHLELARGVLKSFLAEKCPSASDSLALPFDAR